jgi:hypothetical protein
MPTYQLFQEMFDQHSRINPECGWENPTKGWSQCREWTGERNRGGYGVVDLIDDDGQVYTCIVSRVSFGFYKGKIPDDKPFVCHGCDNPPWFNPDHLWAGTHQDNMIDMVKKGRHLGVPKVVQPERPKKQQERELTFREKVALARADQLGIRPAPPKVIEKSDRIRIGAVRTSINGVDERVH